LLDALKDALRRKHAHLAPSPSVNLAAALVARDFIEYDEAYTAPLAGYRNAADYYTQSSCGRLLRNIRCPTLVVHALDDPFMTADIVPELETLSPCVTLEVTRSGGHVGFVSAGALGLPYCWLERRLSAYLHDGYGRRIGAQVHRTDIQSAERVAA
jgi:predicted alpha/beta-fold hydrolase